MAKESEEPFWFWLVQVRMNDIFDKLLGPFVLPAALIGLSSNIIFNNFSIASKYMSLLIVVGFLFKIKACSKNKKDISDLMTEDK